MNRDNREPNINALNKQIEREAAARLRRALDRAKERLYPRLETQVEENRRLGDKTREIDPSPTPSPDIPVDWNVTPEEDDYE